MYLKKLGKQKDINNGGIMMIFTKPWFVIGIVVACFAILTPKIFLPLFRQIFGLNKPSVVENDFEKVPPHLRMRQSPRGPSRSVPSQPDEPSPIENEFIRPGPQFGRSAPGISHKQQSVSSSKSILSFLLPVYAIGIGIYMVYTLFKVFNKNEDEKKGEDEKDSDYDDNYRDDNTGFKFKERKLDSNFIWDANNGEFKFNAQKNNFSRSEESEDEMNDYERYKNLDPDYVAFLKERRKAKRDEARKRASLITKSVTPLKKEDEVCLTPGVGLTSITNTNVLMNDTLERMKYQLNKINSQLANIEKKGDPFEDPELENLRLQLTQTELQMAKIMSIVNTVSSTIGKDNTKMSSMYEASEHDGSDQFGFNNSIDIEEEDDEDYSRNSDFEYEVDNDQMIINEDQRKRQHIINKQYVPQLKTTTNSTSARNRRKKNKNKNKQPEKCNEDIYEQVNESPYSDYNNFNYLMQDVNNLRENFSNIINNNNNGLNDSFPSSSSSVSSVSLNQISKSDSSSSSLKKSSNIKIDEEKKRKQLNADNVNSLKSNYNNSNNTTVNTNSNASKKKKSKKSKKNK